LTWQLHLIITPTSSPTPTNTSVVEETIVLYGGCVGYFR
jgi:hypothetical protein